MKTVKEFDYSLWTTKEGSEKRYWARVKQTGEVTEITHEVMMFLRSEEKRMRRELNEQRAHSDKAPHLDIVPLDEIGERWLEDHTSMEEAVCSKYLMEEFRNYLSPRQRSFFDECLCYGLSQSNFAAKYDISSCRACKYKKIIGKKAKSFFQGVNY